MDELIIRVVTGNASASEVERVRLWRRASTENETYFRQTEGVWALTEPRDRKAYEPPEGVARTVVAGAAAGARAESPPTVAVRPRRRGIRLAPWSPLGWSLALAAGIAALMVGIQVVGTGPTAEAPVATFLGEAGDPRTAVLDDGSLVRLASGSRLDQWAGDEERRLTLTGRAFFAVAHDPARPFAVRVGGTDVRVLGTRFELDERAGGVRAVVVEGVVGVSNERGSVNVPAGSVAQAGADAAPSVTEVEDVHALLDWPGGLLMFQATPLAQVAEEVARHFGRAVEVQDDALGALRISAYFDEEGFEEVLRALCEVSGAQCAPSGDGVSMRSAGP